MRNPVVIVILAFWLLLLQACGNQSGMPDLRETYRYNDARPFGAEIAYRLVEHVFSEADFEKSRKPFLSTWNNQLRDSGTAYISICRRFLVEEYDAKAILDYVYNGNTFFLSSSQIDTVFLNSIYCEVTRNPIMDIPMETNLHQAHVRLVPALEPVRDSFGYYYTGFSSYFSDINDRYARILGFNENGKPNCIVFFWGHGKLILHTEPRAFSNYFLLSDDNYHYWLTLLQTIEEGTSQVVWDTYYQTKNQKRNPGSFSTFSEIFRYPALAAAFWLAVASLLLYILFGGKRRQRILKERPPVANSSIAFTETIARLYLQKKDNKSIADKMITYFNEFVRSHYYLQVATGTEEFRVALSRKSGVPLQQVNLLYGSIRLTGMEEEVTDEQLLELNERIQQFYKKRK